MARKMTKNPLQTIKVWKFKPARFFEVVDEACDLRQKHPDELIQPFYAWISPQIAGRILAERNSHNRNVRNKHVKRLAKDMKAGDWYVTNNSIGFDVTGSLMDGQHRLHAVIEAGEPMIMGVALALDTDAMKGIDQNARRSLADVAHLVEGIKISTAAGRIVNMFVEIATGVKGSDYTMSERFRWYLAYQSSFDFASGLLDRHTNKRGLSCTAVLTGIARAHADGVDPDELSNFYSDLYTMEGEDFRNSPLARKFRDKLMMEGAPKDKDKKMFIIRLEMLIEAYVHGDIARRKNFGTLRSLTYMIPAKLPELDDAVSDEDAQRMFRDESDDE